MGFVISVAPRQHEKTDAFGIKGKWIPLNDSDYELDTIDLLPCMKDARDNRTLMSLSEYCDTDSPVSIHPEGLIIPRGFQVNAYTIEKVAIPEGYILQATTPTGFGRRGGDSVATAGTLNDGWRGVPLCEIRNGGLSPDPVFVEVGQRIVQAYPIPNIESTAYKGFFQDQFPRC